MFARNFELQGGMTDTEIFKPVADKVFHLLHTFRLL